MVYKRYIINFGKKNGLLVVLFGNGFIDTIELEEKENNRFTPQNKPAEETIRWLYKQ